jgi:hypothetical protein
MALGAFSSSDIFYADTGSFPGFELFVKPCKFLVVSIFSKLDLSLAVTFDAPAHAELLNLGDPVHRFHIAMAGFTVHFAGINMLGMIEVSMVREVVHPDPFNRLTGFDRFINFLNLCCPCISALPDYIMAIHAYVNRRDTCMFALHDGGVAIFAVDFIISGMNFMGEKDWLVRRITWLAAHIFCFHDRDLCDDKNGDQDYDNMYEFGLDQFGYKKIEAGGQEEDQ